MLAADMDHGIDNSVFVPFSGVAACTLTSVSRLARLGRARVVPFVTEVLPDFKGYRLTIFPPLIGYYWVHRRFEHRPPGMPALY